MSFSFPFYSNLKGLIKEAGWSTIHHQNNLRYDLLRYKLLFCKEKIHESDILNLAIFLHFYIYSFSLKEVNTFFWPSTPLYIAFHYEGKKPNVLEASIIINEVKIEGQINTNNHLGYFFHCCYIHVQALFLSPHDEKGSVCLSAQYLLS